MSALRVAVTDAVAAGARRVLLTLGGELVVRCDAERVLRLFLMTGVDQVLTLHPDEAASA